MNARQAELRTKWQLVEAGLKAAQRLLGVDRRHEFGRGYVVSLDDANACALALLIVQQEVRKHVRGSRAAQRKGQR